MKPLRYDARSVAAFPNVLLLDTGAKPSPLHVLSASMDPRERAAKEKVIKAQGDTPWVWYTDKPIPPLPEPAGLGRMPFTVQPSVATSERSCAKGQESFRPERFEIE